MLANVRLSFVEVFSAETNPWTSSDVARSSVKTGKAAQCPDYGKHCRGRRRRRPRDAQR